MNPRKGKMQNWHSFIIRGTTESGLLKVLFNSDKESMSSFDIKEVDNNYWMAKQMLGIAVMGQALKID